MEFNYLNSLGIVRWRVQQKSCYKIHLLKEQRLVGLVLADATKHHNSEVALLWAMIKAMKVEGKGEQVVLNFALSNFEVPVIIIMGDTCAQQLLNASVDKIRGQVVNHQRRKLVITYSPATLLNQGELKVKAWQDLQLAMRLWHVD